MIYKELHGKLIRAEYELSRAGVAGSQDEADKPIAVSLELVRECLALLGGISPTAKEALTEIDRLKLVIASAVSFDQPEHAPQVMQALESVSRARALLSMGSVVSISEPLTIEFTLLPGESA